MARETGGWSDRQGVDYRQLPLNRGADLAGLLSLTLLDDGELGFTALVPQTAQLHQQHGVMGLFRLECPAEAVQLQKSRAQLAVKQSRTVLGHLTEAHLEGGVDRPVEKVAPKVDGLLPRGHELGDSCIPAASRSAASTAAASCAASWSATHSLTHSQPITARLFRTAPIEKFGGSQQTDPPPPSRRTPPP